MRAAARVGGQEFDGDQLTSMLVYTLEKSHAKDRDHDPATVGKPKLSLVQKLASFDPDLHGGEVMPNARVGREVF